MEVSSHALAQGRVDGVVYDVAAFTNLSQDHLDFHGTLEDYYRAKASLFTPERARRGVVVVDDVHGRRLAAEAAVPVVTVSAAGSDADWRAEAVVHEPSGATRFRAHGPDDDEVSIGLRLAGDFNVANALVAVAVLRGLGLDAGDISWGISTVQVPGRMERVRWGQDFLGVVDYAHTPDAVDRAISALHAGLPGRVVAVLGCGGDRDRDKRPLMGEVAARSADVVVVTDDNPRSEEPAAIRAAILAGVARVAPAERAEVHEIADRREAIRFAVASAAAGDAVLVLGKGHEQGQEVGDTVLPFDDRSVLRDAIGARGGDGAGLADR
jgi:UDP-N-acetylmuramoyl-L-alanyl-D-glutamate--2,6-diaminopimelate ligase